MTPASPRRGRRGRPRASAAMVALTVCGAAAGCGESPDSAGRPAVDAGRRLAVALERSRDARSMRASFEIVAEVGDEPRVEIAGRGTFTTTGSRDHMTATVTEGSEPPFPMEVVSIGESFYVRFPSERGLLPPGKRWLRIGDSGVGSTTLTPADALELLTAGGRVEDLGVERVRSQTATHLRTRLDMHALLTRSRSAAARKLLRVLGGRRLPLAATMHLWVPSSGLPSRAALVMRSTTDVRCFVSLIADIFAYDVPTTATAPPRRLVTDVRHGSGP